MPWKATSPVELRSEFIDACLARNHPPITELAALYGISEKTAHKWLARFREGGRPALDDHSRRPLHSPHAMSREVRRALIALRKKYRWGPKKLVELLRVLHPDLRAPSPSTVGELLLREGLVSPRRRAHRVGSRPQPFAPVNAPNDTWNIDHKGEFNVERRACYPLTLSDAFSRYLLLLTSCRSTAWEEAKPGLDDAFQENGLPLRIRSDNGPPFGSRGIGGLSKMSVYLAHLQIEQEFITPGHPQDNGRHERIHRTMIAENAIASAGSTWQDQERLNDEFRFTYNQVRPHEALEMLTPAKVYRPSPRPFPSRLPELQYPPGLAIRRVRHTGELKWQGCVTFLSETLIGEDVGLLESNTDGWWDLRLGNWDLGLVSADGKLLRRKRALWIAEKEATASSEAVHERELAGRGEPLPAPIPGQPTTRPVSASP